MTLARLRQVQLAHPWLDPNNLQAGVRLLRGELEIPHSPGHCVFCETAFEQQLRILGYIKDGESAFMVKGRIETCSPKRTAAKLRAKITAGHVSSP